MLNALLHSYKKVPFKKKALVTLVSLIKKNKAFEGEDF